MTNSLFDELKRMGFPADGFAIFGSGPLIIRGIIPFSNDLDVVCRPRVWDAVCTVGEVEYLPGYNVSVAKLCDGAITFGTAWGIGEVDVGEVIDNAEIIDGLPFARIDDVVRYKRLRSSPKDLEHLAAIKAAGYWPTRGGT